MRLKTKFWAKDMRIIKDSYRENYDKIRWVSKVETGMDADKIKCDADKTGEE